MASCPVGPKAPPAPSACRRNQSVPPVQLRMDMNAGDTLGCPPRRPARWLGPKYLNQATGLQMLPVLPVRVLSRRFRTLFLDRLRAAFVAGALRFSGAL